MISVLAAHYLASGVLALVLLLVAAVVASAGVSLTVWADRRAASAVDVVLPERPMWTLADLLAGDDDRDDRGVPVAPVDVAASTAGVVDPIACGRHSARCERPDLPDYAPRHAKPVAESRKDSVR